MAEQRPESQSEPTASAEPGDAAAGAPDPQDAAVSQAEGGANIDLPSFQQVLADVEQSGIELLHDVELNVKIELGRTNMLVEDVLRLNSGSVVELDKLAGDPVDIYVNERLVARGEVLVLNDNFCVRISEIVAEVEDNAGDHNGTTEASNGEASEQARSTGS